MGNAKKLFETLSTDPAAAKLLEGAGKPDSVEELLQKYAEIAAKLGIPVTIEELAEEFKAAEKAVAEQTEQISKGIESLDLENLDKVAGGKSPNEACTSSFLDEENCWASDGCDMMLRTYWSYVCKKYYRSQGRVQGNPDPFNECEKAFFNINLDPKTFPDPPQF